MKLFVKIFLWFLAAIAVMVGVVIFVTRTFQTGPMESRWQRSSRNQMIVFGDTATQIAASDDNEGVRQFLTRLRDLDPPREVALIGMDGRAWFGEDLGSDAPRELAERALSSDAVETDFSAEERPLGAAPVIFPDGRRFVLVIQWERQPSPSLFSGSWLSYLRLAGLLLTAVVVCYLLAVYLTSPITKLRRATRELAGGDLNARVPAAVGRRRDELGDLARDFDEMAERIESLITSQKGLNRDISHELRSPLARLNVALEIAKQKSSVETAQILERIETESTRLNEMISRLLTLAKLETGAVDIERQRVGLAGLVSDIAADAQFEAQAKGKSVKVSSLEHCTVVGSENLLRSAIENVLRNAVRYTSEGTHVDVSLAAKNGSAVLQVRDHGGGVPDADLDKIFRPFYRVGEARERRTGGTGLGLAIAERAIKAHQGTIQARNVNGGLLIEICLKSEVA